MGQRLFVKVFFAALSFVMVCASVWVLPLEARQITPAQLEQFHKLPRAQQEVLARQYGVDLSLLDNQGTAGLDFEKDKETVTPRADEQRDKLFEELLLEKQKIKEEEIKPFGYNLFAGQPTTFSPVNNAPVPGNYRLGAGDTVLLQLFGQESISHTLIVDREGRLTIPKLGPIAVAGLSYDEMKSLINHQVTTRLLGMQAAISMGELRSMQIFVLGEAHQPGAYTVSALTTISQALFASGGLTDIASLRNVRLMRAGEVVTEFDLYDLLIRGDASKDRILQPGDAVFIPPRGGMVRVEGEVTRPAIYEVKQGETLAHLIEFAGGLLPSAYDAALLLQRKNNNQRVSRTLDASKKQVLAAAIYGGDELLVPKISAQLDNSVQIIGAVTRPGAYEWRPGVKISHFISSFSQDLLPDADFSYGLIVRESAKTREIKVLQFDVTSALRGDAKHDKLLEARDQVLFFSRFESEYQRALAGFGEHAENPEGVLEEEKESQEKRELRAAQMRDLLSRGTDNSLTRRNAEQEDFLSKETPAPNSRTLLLRSVLARLQSQETQEVSASLIQVSGEVRFPGAYPLVQDATVADLIAAAGGLKESAYLARAEITRTLIADEVAETDYLAFSLFDALTGTQSIKVQARDRLNIFKIPEWQDTVEVEIAGEVRFPGVYAMRRGETLNNLIARAGGLTAYAYSSGAVFTREEIRERERERLDALVRSLRQEMASISLTDSGRVADYEQLNLLLNDLHGAEPIGRMVLNLPAIISGRDASDVELRDEDKLYIPSMSNSISIIGEVHMPTTYRFNPALSVREYIERSGGAKRRADTKRMFVVRANGEIVPYNPRRGWFSSDSRLALAPGDTIVVPLDSTYKDNMQMWASSTQIIYQLAVAAAAISRI